MVCTDNQIQPSASKSMSRSCARSDLQIVQNRRISLYELSNKIDDLSYNLEALSRFISLQTIGFKKLLKKYKNCSGSNRLNETFLPIFDGPNSFTKYDFTDGILKLSILYIVLREEKSSLGNDAIDNSVDSFVSFDREVFSESTNSATFWVHADNITELKIKLSKHFNLITDPTVRMMTSELSSGRRNSSSGCSRNSITNQFMLQNLQTTRSRKSSISSSQHIPRLTSDSHDSHIIFLGSLDQLHSVNSGNKTGQISWSETSQPSSATQNYALCSPVGGIRHTATTSLSKNITDNIFAHSTISIRKSEEYQQKSHVDKLAVDWVEKTCALPVSQVNTNRSRYTQINKGPRAFDERPTSSTVSCNDNKVWATLDTSVKFSLPNLDTATSLQLTVTDSSGAIDHNYKFPYAVLEISWRSIDKPSIVSEIEKSHLVYPVIDFSLFSHSLSLFHPEKLSSQPNWIKLLDSNYEIKRVPSFNRIKTRRRAKIFRENQLSNYEESINLGSDSAPSSRSISRRSSTVNSAELTPLSSPNTINEPAPSKQAGKVRFQQAPTVSPTPIRYWNEFDNPGSDEEGAGTFFIDEESNSNYGSLLLDNCVEFFMSISDKLCDTLSIIKSLGRARGSEQENQPLIHENRQLQPSYSYNTINNQTTGLGLGGAQAEDYFSQPRNPHQNLHRCGTYSPDQESQLDYTAKQLQYDKFIKFLYSFALFLSCLVTSVTFGFLFAGLKEKMDPIIVITVIFGLLFSLLLAVISSGIFLSTCTSDFIHQIGFLLTFGTVVCFDIGGLSWIFY